MQEEAGNSRYLKSKWLKIAVGVFVLALIIAALSLGLYLYLNRGLNNSDTQIDKPDPSSSVSYSISKDGISWSFTIPNEVSVKQVSSEELELSKGDVSILVSPSFNFAVSWVNDSDVTELGNTVKFMHNNNLYRIRIDDKNFTYVDQRKEGCIQRYDQKSGAIVTDTICVDNSLASLNLSMECTSNEPSKCDAILDIIDIQTQGTLLKLPVSSIEFQHESPYLRFRFPTDRYMLTYSVKEEQPKFSLYPEERANLVKPAEIAIRTAEAPSPQTWLEKEMVSGGGSYIVNGTPATTLINGHEFLEVHGEVQGVSVKRYIYALNSTTVLVIGEASPGIYSDQDEALEEILNTFTTERNTYIQVD